MPQTVAEKFIGCIRAILYKRQSVLLNKGQHFLPGYREHGTNDVPVHRRNTAQTTQSCAPYKMHQNCFSIVICGMCRSDFSWQRGKESISCLPRSGLQAFSARHDLRLAHSQGNIIAAAEIPDKSLVPIRFC